MIGSVRKEIEPVTVNGSGKKIYVDVDDVVSKTTEQLLT
jgi:hypothetical protein